MFALTVIAMPKMFSRLREKARGLRESAGDLMFRMKVSSTLHTDPLRRKFWNWRAPFETKLRVKMLEEQILGARTIEECRVAETEFYSLAHIVPGSVSRHLNILFQRNPVFAELPDAVKRRRGELARIGEENMEALKGPLPEPIEQELRRQAAEKGKVLPFVEERARKRREQLRLFKKEGEEESGKNDNEKK